MRNYKHIQRFEFLFPLVMFAFSVHYVVRTNVEATKKDCNMPSKIMICLSSLWQKLESCVASHNLSLCILNGNLNLTKRAYTMNTAKYNMRPINHTVQLHMICRSPQGWLQCLRSVLSLHNETLNIWTHLLGAVFFLVLLAWDCTAPPAPDQVLRCTVRHTVLYCTPHCTVLCR